MYRTIDTTVSDLGDAAAAVGAAAVRVVAGWLCARAWVGMCS